MQISTLASMEWLHLLMKQLGFEWKLYDSKLYNITISVLACDKDIKPTIESIHKDNIDEEESTEKNSQNADSFLSQIVNYLTATPLVATKTDVVEPQDNGCTSIFHYSEGHNVSIFLILWLSVLGIIAATLLFYIILKKCQESITQSKDDKTDSNFVKKAVVDFEISSDDFNTETKKRPSDIKRVLTLHLSKMDKVFLYPSKPVDQILDETLWRFLKELDFYLSVEISPVNGSGSRTSLPSPQSSSSLNSMATPRLSRKFPQNQQSPKSLPNIIIKKVDDLAVLSWIKFEKQQQRLSWSYPCFRMDGFDYTQLSSVNRNICILLQFLQQNCVIKPQQWTIATMVVNYCFYLLENVLKSDTEDSEDFLSFTTFESIGSAADGTIIGSANRFDLLMVLDISHCSEVTILHSNVSQDIPPGYVALRFNDCDTIPKGSTFIKRAFIENQFGMYLVPEGFKDTAEMLLTRSVQKLNRNFKNKLDSLPFSFYLSSDKRFTLKIDTRLLSSLGLGVENINVNIIPALKISLPEFSLLSTIYAVPPWKDSNQPDKLTKTLPKTTLSRVFRGASNEDLLWSLCTEKLKMSVVEYFDERLHLSGVEGYHKECVMILKALFSYTHKNKLLNKGEVDSLVLSTVIHFLLQESNPSSWTLSSLPDRLSDAVHFLRSAYKNNFLPNFLIHNPHLVTQCQFLEVLSPLLSGKQQNLLAHICNEDALKVLEFVDSRLQETGLSQCMKDEFSSQMWEYEFFIFG
ncbi:CAunnamed protein product [Biomphalaria glabrata]|nr:CAunnamed protein product [Biomphalaria glabrata]